MFIISVLSLLALTIASYVVGSIVVNKHNSTTQEAIDREINQPRPDTYAIEQYQARIMSSASYKLVSLVFAIATVVTVVLNSYTIVSAGHVKVPVLFGEVQDAQLTEGLQFPVNPLLEFVSYDIRDITTTIDQIEVPSQDKLKSTMDVSIVFAVASHAAPKMYQTAGKLEEAYNKYVVPKARSLLREAGKTVEQSQDFFKDEVQARLQGDLEAGLREYLEPKGFVIKAVLIRDIDLPKVVRDAIVKTKERQEEIEQEKAALAKVEQQALQQVKQAEAANAAATQNAEAKQKMADAIAYEKLAVAKAVAEGNNLINKSLTGQLIEYKKAEQWNGVLPKMTGGVVPMFNVGDLK